MSTGKRGGAAGLTGFAGFAGLVEAFGAAGAAGVGAATVVVVAAGGLTYVVLAFATRAVTVAEVKGLIRKGR